MSSKPSTEVADIPVRESAARTFSNSAMTPQEIVSELDRHIVGQGGAKRAVAIALRNRWRRQQVEEAMRGENRAVGFTEAHRLVALFFGAMGINEHAKVRVRMV